MSENVGTNRRSLDYGDWLVPPSEKYYENIVGVICMSIVIAIYMYM